MSADLALGEGLTTIGSGAFSGCIGLARIAVPDKVATIESYAFRDCTNLVEISIGKALAWMGDAIFLGCSGLTSITVDALNLTYSSRDGVLFAQNQTVLLHWPRGRFGTCSVPDGVIQLGPEAFTNCERLTGMSLPLSLASGPFIAVLSVSFPVNSSSPHGRCSLARSDGR